MPMPRDASFARTSSVLTPAIIFHRGRGSRCQAATPSYVTGRQSRWAGSGIPRRARVSGTHRHIAQSGNQPELSRGRSPTAARTFLLVEEDSQQEPARILPFVVWLLKRRYDFRSLNEVVNGWRVCPRLFLALLADRNWGIILQKERKEKKLEDRIFLWLSLLRTTRFVN